MRQAKFRKTKNNIREDIDPAKYLLKWTEQFSPYIHRGKVYYGCVSAYACYPVTTLKEIDTGFNVERHWRQGNLDHRIPNQYNAGNSGFNLQYLDAKINSKELKGGKPTIAARWEAYRQGGEIEFMEFVSPFVNFIKLFSYHHKCLESGRTPPSDESLSICWPWWLRTENYPHYPFAPGFNHKTGRMELSSKDSYVYEWNILANNVLVFMDKCQIPEVKAKVEYEFATEYGTTISDMSSKRVDWSYHHLFN